MNSNINFFGQQERRCRREKEIQKKTIVNCIDKQRAESQTLRFTRMHWLFIYMHICGWVWVRMRELYTHAHRVPRARSLTTTRIRQLAFASHYVCGSAHLLHISSSKNIGFTDIYIIATRNIFCVVLSVWHACVYGGFFVYGRYDCVCLRLCVSYTECDSNTEYRHLAVRTLLLSRRHKCIRMNVEEHHSFCSLAWTTIITAKSTIHTTWEVRERKSKIN